jgi:hypothetical protein
MLIRCFLHPTNFRNTLESNGVHSHSLIVEAGLSIMIVRNLYAISLCHDRRTYVEVVLFHILEAINPKGDIRAEMIYVYYKL